MRICGYERAGEWRVGIVDGDTVVDAGTDLLAPEPTGDEYSLGGVTLTAPVPRPGKVLCVGRNYAEHASETGAEAPVEPQLFAKWANAVIATGAPIVYPEITHALDYEAELVVVIGRRAKGVSLDRALGHVLGYTCGDDVSARDLQFGDTQWTRGKALDTFAPMGPWIVTVDEIPDPQTLGIRCVVNGKVLQDANTADMLFGVAEIIEFASQAITLDPGDVIMTGTPPGVGFARTPPIFLHPGDTVRVEIDRIGALENPVVDP